MSSALFPTLLRLMQNPCRDVVKRYKKSACDSRLFRKVQESQKEQVESRAQTCCSSCSSNVSSPDFRSCAVEFGAILSNYENEGYRQVLDRTACCAPPPIPTLVPLGTCVSPAG